MNPLRQHLPVFARHEGEWQGTYRHLSPAGELLDLYDVRIRCEFPDQGETHFRLHMTYQWEDGRTQEGVHEARYDEASGRARWSSEGIDGEIWDVDDATVYLVFTPASRPGVKVHEMIQLSADGQRRARVWQWLRESDGELLQWTLVTEHRVGS